MQGDFSRIAYDVLIVSGVNEKNAPQCLRYRVLHQVEQLTAAGLAVTWIPYEQCTHYSTLDCRMVVFYRCPFTEGIGDAIRRAKGLNISIYFDIDDLVFDRTFTDQIPSVAKLSRSEKAIYDNGVVRMAATMQLCNYGITTTERLKEEMEKTLPAVYINRNCASEEMLAISENIRKKRLLSEKQKYGITRYHQVSTDEVYGDLPLDRPDLFFTEETPIHTSSPYSSSKAAADLLVMAYHRTYGLPVTISRCSNNYGPYHFPEKLIPLMIANALADKPLPVYGTGENVRDWLYVEDHCKAIDLIIHKGRVGQVYNVGGHNEMKNIDIVKIICKALGKPESLITFVTDRKGHDMRYAIDPTKIHSELGWLPEAKYADGIQKTIDWYLNNRQWWETIISGEYQNYYEKMYGNR